MADFSRAGAWFAGVVGSVPHATTRTRGGVYLRCQFGVNLHQQGKEFGVLK